MRTKLQQLQVFQREWIDKAPDGSEIGLGPQKFNPEAETNGPGSNATATFMPGAANAVMHNELAEQWFYIDGPDFYIWLCPEEEPVTAGQYYKITPGTKFEIPPRTKFQVYNPSNEPAPVLMVTFPFWPQDGSAMNEIAFPEGPFQPKDALPFQSNKIDNGYIERLYTEDPIAQASSSGFEYIQNALASIGEDVSSYRIAGENWFEFTGPLEYVHMPRPEGCNVCEPLNSESMATMHVEVEQFEQKLAQRKAEAQATFETGMQHYQAGDYWNADNYFSLAKRLGSASGAFYVGILFECGEGREIDTAYALECYKEAVNLGHYGASQNQGKQLYSARSHPEMQLFMQPTKEAYDALAARYVVDLKAEGKNLVIAENFAEALKKYELASRIAPENETLWFNKGLCLKRLDRQEDALEAFNKALELKPEYLKAQYQVELLNGNSDQATLVEQQYNEAQEGEAKTLAA